MQMVIKCKHLLKIKMKDRLKIKLWRRWICRVCKSKCVRQIH